MHDESPDVVQLTPAPDGSGADGAAAQERSTAHGGLVPRRLERAAAAATGPVVLFVHGFGQGLCRF